MPEDREAAALGAGGVQVVTRAISILRVLGGSTGDMTLAQVAEHSGLPRSTVRRIVQTLEELTFVSHGPRNRGLRLGPELARLTARSRIEFVRTVRPFLSQLSRKVDETAGLSVLDGAHVRFIDRTVTRHGPGEIALVCRVPAHCTANGKALLAALPPPQLEASLPRSLQRLTDRTIATRSELLAELERVREAGVAFNREEYAPGVCGIGKVVKDAAGRVGAITVAMPAQRFYGHEDELMSILGETVEQVNAALADPRSVGAA
jgi:DNA-binding IclR family transcriptional regulator